MTARARTLLAGLAMTAVFLFNWILRYNDPEGSFGGLTDDHFFYLVQAWQMLFGDLPDRDYNDIGAPLTFAISAGLQVVLGRSVWSEYVFCVTALSVGAALTCALAARATGSILLGIVAALFEIALRPRLYNYPKIIVYAVGIALLWHWISAPRTRRTWLFAAMTAFAFLMRHDHGIYLGVAFGAALAAMSEMPWRTRFRHAIVYAVATLVLLTPYLIYLQANGGIVRHFASASGWSARDYRRAPLVLPAPEFPPLVATAVEEGISDWWQRPPFAALGDLYYTWWLYWLMVLLPAVVLLLLVANRTTGPPGWPQARGKMIAVAVLMLVLDARLLRGNLAGRFADLSVPVAILAVWLLAEAFRAMQSWHAGSGEPRRQTSALRAAAVAATLFVALFTAGVLVKSTGELVRNSSLLDGVAAAERDMRLVTRLVERTWPLDSWTSETRGQIGLAKYLEACTAPSDRVLMGPFLPPVLALAQRGFAGGRIDLRGGFFDSPAEQALTVERLRRQSVPIVIGPPIAGLDHFAHEFPIIAEYIRREYQSAGEHDLGDGLTFSLLVRRGTRASGRYDRLALPCFR